MSAGGSEGRLGDAMRPPALQEAKTSHDLNVAHAASGAEVECVQITYGRCSPVGITELLLERAKKEPPGTRLALLQIWKLLMAKLGAKIQSLEPLWVNADLDPQAVVTPEDRAHAETAAEEALAPCRLCAVNLPTFLNSILRRVVLAAKPNGDLLLAVEFEYNSQHAFVVTKLAAWMRKTKEGVEYVVPLNFREHLRRLGLDVETDPYDLYVELTRRAEYYNTVVDAYLKPILLQVVEKLRAAPHLAKCSRNRGVIYIAAEVFRTSAWYFDAYVGLGRNQLYEALRRHGLLASAGTVPIDFYDEYGVKVKKRALPFYIDRLSGFIDYDISAICRAAAGLRDAAVESGEEQSLSGDHV